MIQRLKYMLIVGVVLLSAVSCDDSGSPSGLYVDEMTWEAERAAMILGYEPEDAPELVADIAHDLKRIRERFGGWFDFDGHRVHFPWDAFKTNIFLSAEGEALLESGNWPELDAALAACGADSVGIFDGERVAFFSEPTNPCVVQRVFEDVEHAFAVTRWWYFVCDDPCGFIWPIPTATGMDYLFIHSFDGDDTSEPEPREYYYFRADDRHDVQLVGSYLPGEYPTPYDASTPQWLLDFSRFRLYGCSN